MKAAGLLLHRAKGARYLIADKGYHANAIRKRLREDGKAPVIPGRINRKRKIAYDKARYRGRLLAIRASMRTLESREEALRRAVLAVALLNLGYFGIEFAVALDIGSVSLFADSIDFLEDTSVNFLIVVALGWSAIWRARVGMALAAILLVPTLATLWAAWEKFAAPVPPEPLVLSLTGAGALVINLGCALILARHRHHSGGLSKAAFLSARNDALANVAIIIAGLVTVYTLSAWPDLIVGLGIAALNADAARQVIAAARKDHLKAEV